jgi:hypothetical protein
MLIGKSDLESVPKILRPFRSGKDYMTISADPALGVKHRRIQTSRIDNYEELVVTLAGFIARCRAPPKVKCVPGCTSHAAGAVFSSAGLRRVSSNSKTNAIPEHKMATSNNTSLPNRVNNAMKSGGDAAEMTFRGRAMRDAADAYSALS